MNTEQGYLLVVEDIPDILRLLDATLKFKGYRVVTARNGQEALEAIQRERPALIITDILMPKMDGFSLVHRLRINPETRDIPVVFLTATYVAPEDKAFAMTIGVNRFIEKPVDFQQFLPAIEEILTKGAAAPAKLIDETEFYEGYRRRLETKLKQKMTQIARSEHLLQTVAEEERATMKASLQQATIERQEIQHLLDEIHAHLDKIAKRD
ncbi:MAG TPA: response regulator [Anaerolineales bacterium]|nr:response regulator [Anaerolineales bacterium]